MVTSKPNMILNRKPTAEDGGKSYNQQTSRSQPLFVLRYFTGEKSSEMHNINNCRFS